MNLFPQIIVCKKQKINLNYYTVIFKRSAKGSGFTEYKADNECSIPVGFAMALAGNKSSFMTFLSLDDSEQLRILGMARECETQRERQLLANSLSKDKK